MARPRLTKESGPIKRKQPSNKAGTTAEGNEAAPSAPRVKRKAKREIAEDGNPAATTDGSKDQSAMTAASSSTKPSIVKEKVDGGGDEAPAPQTVKPDGAGLKTRLMDATKQKSPDVSRKAIGTDNSAPKTGNPQGGGESSDDDGDGFKIVVGRDRENSAGPAVPVKRFLRGTNTLVNNVSGSGTNASKTVSAAAGIASLVPSKGAQVAAPRPSLKPGEYPSVSELQRPSGRSAFDVDIDGMEEQPWRHPGVDVADFFNYGFTEDSWRVYCEKQLRNRYDQTQGRSKPGQLGGISLGSQGRHGGGNGPRRGGDRGGGVEPPRELHNSGPGRPSFPPPGPGPNDQWSPGPRSAQFPQNYGSGPPSGAMARGGNGPPRPWFDGPSPGFQGNARNMQLGPMGISDQGGDMGHWNGGDRQEQLRQQGGMPRDGRLGGDNVDQRGLIPQDMRARDGGRDGGPRGRKRSRSPVPRTGPPGLAR